MLRKVIVFAALVLMVTVMAKGQETQGKFYDLRPDLKKKKFTDGKHLIKTLPDGRKVSLGFKAGKIVEIYLTDKTGKEQKGILAEGKVSTRPLPPEARSIEFHFHARVSIDFCSDDKPCRSVIFSGGFFDDDGDAYIEVLGCC